MPSYELPGVEALREMAADDAGSIFAPKGELDECRAVFFDRELSWLAFDHRVMLEAAEQKLPLYERLKFLAIWASNLDEFFMVRVGGLVDQDQLRPFKADLVSGLTPRERLDLIARRTTVQLPSAEKLYTQITDAMRDAGVEILRADLTDPVDAALCAQQFDVIRPLLTAQVVPAGKPFPFLRGKEQCVIAILSGGKRAELGLVPIARLPKYTAFHVNGVLKILPTAELVLRFASSFFPDREVEEARLLRVTRNAEINMQDLMADCEADMRAVMERALRRRRRLQPVRAQLCPDASKRLVKRVAVGLELPQERVFVSSFPNDLSFVYAMEGEMPDGMKRPPLAPAKNAALQKGDYFSYLARHDLLIALPYQRIDPFVDLLYEAADHPQVESIHITLYRLAGSSRIAAALSYAAQQGKKVVCVLELRARFDEQNNIDYSRMLEAAGCEVRYGLTDYKVHTKLCLIARRLPQGLAYYTQVGTGNYNESTAEQYTDLMLLTTDPAIGRDAAKVFRALAQNETVPETETLWIAPEGYRSRVCEMIDRETAAGANGYIAIKVNSMNDPEIMLRLIAASRAGVEIRLYVRGICCLKPGVAGYTENVHIRSIIGRYLEHERIFVFGRDDRRRVFLGSGDLLLRNTRKRVEAFAEVRDGAIQTQLLHILESMERDNCKAWILRSDGSYARVNPGGAAPYQSQLALHDYFAAQKIEKPKPKSAPVTVKQSAPQPVQPEAPSEPPPQPKKLPWWKRLWRWLMGD